MQFVLLCERDHRVHAAADISRLRDTAQVRVLRQSRIDELMLIEFQGNAQDLRNLLGGLPGWVISESRTYHLS